MQKDDSTSAGTYWESPHSGITILVTNNVVNSIFLHADGKDEFSQYQGSLPYGLTFSSSRDDARAILGAPVSSSDGVYIPDLTIGGWDRFQLPGISLHLTYKANNQAISLVTLDKWGIPMSSHLA